MLPLILGAVSSVASVIGGIFNRRAEVKKAEHEVKIAVETRKKELALSKDKFDELVVLNALARKDTILRRVSYVLLTAPFLVAIYDPALVERYFSVALKSVPEWYQMMYVGMVGAIWGLPELVNRIRASIRGK